MRSEANTGLDYWPKFWHIVPTYLAVGILTVAGLIAIRLALAEYLPKVDVKEDVWEVWMPMLFPILPVAIWLRPRIKILKFDDQTDDRHFFFLMIAACTMVAPSMIAQHFILRGMAELHEVPNVNAIDPERLHRYYSISEFEVEDHLGGAHADIRASGRYNEDLNLDFFFVFPIVKPGAEVGSDHSYWYGVKRREQISNRLSVDEKERRYKSSYEHAIRMVESYDFHGQEYLEVLPASDDRDNFRVAVQSSPSAGREKDTVILVPGEGTFPNRTGETFDWIFLSSGIGFAAFVLFLIWPTYDRRELARQKRGEMPDGNLVEGLKEFFIPRNDYFAAPILLDAIIIVYLVQIFSGIDPIHPTGGELLEWGANRRSETVGGEWWRLVTSMFLHGGLMHLVLNAYGLLLAAVFVEPSYGRIKFFVIYLLAGVGGSLASIWWHEDAVSVGASGAIFGLFGAIFSLAAMGVMRFGDLTWLWVFLAINLLFGLTGGIDNAAHIGGLISGALIGLLLQLSRKLRHE